jgi:hypothetical protein
VGNTGNIDFQTTPKSHFWLFGRQIMKKGRSDHVKHPLYVLAQFVFLMDKMILTKEIKYRLIDIDQIAFSGR